MARRAPNKSARSRGRPCFEPTASMRRQVSIAAGGGMIHEEIAIGLGISVETLNKYFVAELTQGANARRMEVIEAMHRAAKKGSSSAARAYLAIEAKLAAPPLPEGEKPAPAKGKKEQAQEDAANAQAGTSWEGLLEPPRALQ